VKVKKAVITAAAERQRALPLQTLIDRDGEEKSVLGILVEQALAANVEEVCVVVWPGDEERYAQAVGKHLGHVRFTPQPRPLGYGDAVYCARDFTGGEAFLHLVGDHLWVGSSPTHCSLTLVQLAEKLRNRSDIEILIMSEGPGADHVAHEAKTRGLTNLQVLPKDLTGRQVHGIMESFAGALGVHCDF